MEADTRRSGRENGGEGGDDGVGVRRACGRERGEGERKHEKLVVNEQVPEGKTFPPTVRNVNI